MQVQGVVTATTQAAVIQAIALASGIVVVIVDDRLFRPAAKLTQARTQPASAVSAAVRVLIRLEDGTVWKQANADDRYRPKVTDHPAAAVIHGVFGYKMRIEGTQEFYVDPVRKP